MTTNPDDIVLDGFAGTGTSALVAKRLGRHFIAIEQDGGYLTIAARRLADNPSTEQCAKSKPSGRPVSKRRLQLELQRLARLLGRLPDRADIELFSQLDPLAFEERFASWSDALKAARLVVPDSIVAPDSIVVPGSVVAPNYQVASAECDESARNQLELFKPASSKEEDAAESFG